MLIRLSLFAWINDDHYLRLTPDYTRSLQITNENQIRNGFTRFAQIRSLSCKRICDYNYRHATFFIWIISSSMTFIKRICIFVPK